MAIIGTLPNNIQNGQSVDANPVMADLNFIVNQVNANAQPVGTISPGSLVNIQVITANGSYTPTVGATKAIIEMCGGGGAGGGIPSTSGAFMSAGGGGGGGGYLKLWIPSGLQSYSGTAIAIGAAGAGASGAVGGTGGNTTFGALATAYGGSGGSLGQVFSTAVGGAPTNIASYGGTPSNVSASSLTVVMIVLGSTGEPGLCQETTYSLGGNGGGSPLGAGGRGGNFGILTGAAGNGYGAGGGGTAASGSAAAAGFNGSQGVFITYEFA